MRVRGCETANLCLLDLPQGVLDAFAAFLEVPDRLSLSHTCRTLHAAGRGWFACVKVQLPPALDAAGLARWLQGRTGLASAPTLVHLTIRGPDNVRLATDTLAVLPAQRMGSLVVHSYREPQQPTSEPQEAPDEPQEPPTLALSALDGMDQLTHLSMMDCTLGGDLETLGQLTALQSLSLEYCGLQRVPPSLAALTRLTQLTIFDSELGRDDSLTAVLPQLVHLEELSLARCEVGELPAGTTALTRLTYLDLTGNLQLAYARLAALPQLRQLELNCNAAQPADLEVLSVLTALTALSIAGDGGPALDLGSVPEAIARLTALQQLGLEWANLEGGWEHLRPLLRLTALSLMGNNLAEVPSGLTALQALEVLDLGHNWPHAGWENLLALPRLRCLVTGRMPPPQVCEAIAEIELETDPDYDPDAEPEAEL